VALLAGCVNSIGCLVETGGTLKGSCGSLACDMCGWFWCWVVWGRHCLVLVISPHRKHGLLCCGDCWSAGHVCRSLRDHG
jgi:hypothetical protein